MIVPEEHNIRGGYDTILACRHGSIMSLLEATLQILNTHRRACCTREKGNSRQALYHPGPLC